jgi:23S rRNA (cytidine1920-2'-O)/16S rRNA (cytidine1409-2'-O)-methyltransferase
MTRIDSRLFELGMASSRSQAAQLISRGIVEVDGKRVQKPSQKVTEKQRVEVLEAKHFVSRAGFKLDNALDSFQISIEGRICLDIGASTGGFTDCLLQRGAAMVLALDVGTAQLVNDIAENAAVRELSNQNIREFSKDQMLSVSPEFEKLSVVVCDLSFISITHALPIVHSLSSELDMVALIKPQFEVGQHSLSASGVVSDWRERRRAIEQVVDESKKLGFKVMGLVRSTIKGATGNQEYLIWLNKGGSNISDWDGNIEALVKGD